MVRYNIGRYITAIVILSIIVYLILSLISITDSIFQNITTTVTIVTIICTIFVLWAWKWQIWRIKGWLVPFPCLSGKWNGELISTYKSENRSIHIEVEIKHNFFNIQIRLKTNESKSRSICGSFDIDEDRGLRQLFYSFENIPEATKRDVSEIHFGTARLEIGDPATILEGEYWTSRGTTGTIRMRKM